VLGFVLDAAGIRSSEPGSALTALVRIAGRCMATLFPTLFRCAIIWPQPLTNKTPSIAEAMCHLFPTTIQIPFRSLAQIFTNSRSILRLNGAGPYSNIFTKYRGTFSTLSKYKKYRQYRGLFFEIF
jgi:hypothetical protein